MNAMRGKLKNLSNREVMYFLIAWTAGLSVLSVFTHYAEWNAEQQAKTDNTE